MTTTLEKTSPTQLTITVSVPYAELEPLLPKAAEKISNEIEIEGFRKGKAPYEVVKQKLGEFKILEEAARMHIQKNFASILEEAEEKEFKGKSFEPVGEPAVGITKLAAGSDLEYKISLFILPPVELADYRAVAKKILATRKIAEVAEKEIEAAREWLRESRAKLITVNRGAERGDRVEVNYSAKTGGVRIEGLESKNHPLVIGKSRFIPGFEEELLGMKEGETKTFALVIPKDYHAQDIAGKSVDFSAEMKLVQSRDIPEWNDEFAKSLGNFGSAADADKNIREGLQAEKEEREKERLRISIIDAVAAGSRIEIPEPLAANELEKMLAELESSIGRMGLKFEDYLAHLKKTADDLKREWRGDAERRVKTALVLREIARKENIAPGDEEVEEAVNRTITHLGLTEEDFKEIDPVRGKPRRDVGAAAPWARASNGVDREAFINYNRGVARNEKVFKFLESLA